MKKILFAVLVMCLLFFVGCLRELEPVDCSVPENVRVSFDIRSSSALRSSISPDEDNVNDCNVYIYSRGILVKHIYEYEPEDISAELSVGSSYNVYVLANACRQEALASEEEFLCKCAYEISSVDDMGEFLPLAGCVRNISVAGEGQRICVTLERLVSKIVFSVDKSDLAGLTVSSARLCQSALRVRPFCEGGSAVMTGHEVADGDFCTAADLSVLNGGGEVQFYALENCQGVLIPGNEDPWGKVPSGIGDKADLCTFIEVVCSFDGAGVYDGEVTYRLYLGQDNCADFNILRNSVLRVSLCLTHDGLRDIVSWRVDPDCSLRDGHASGWISRGLHDESDLYVGEKFEYSIWLSDEMWKHLGNETDECEVVFRSFDTVGEIPVTFSEILMDEQGKPYVEALCLRPAEGEICLKEKDGDIMAVLSEYVCVNSPRICVSRRSYDDGSEMMDEVVEGMTCGINGEPVRAYVYLVDSESFNLNLSSGCGYDLSVFDFDLKPELDAPQGISTSFDLVLTQGEDSGDGPALSFLLSCTNDGTDHSMNMNLLRAVSQGQSVSWQLVEGVCDMCHTVSSGIMSLPIELSLVDGERVEYDDAQMSVVMDNPSNLPIEVEGWQFVTVNDSYDGSLREQVVAKVENELVLNPMEYVASVYAEGSLPVYGSSFSFVSERNGYGTPAHEEGELLIYGLEGVDNVIAALTYDGWGYDSMSHHMQVRFSDGASIGELTVNDWLSDSDGLNDKGIWLYEGRRLILAPDASFGSYPGLNPYNVRLMMDQKPVVGVFEYDKSSENIYLSASLSGAEGLVLDTHSSVEADGYVRTYPDGTWGKPVDNYCHEGLSGEAFGVPVRHDAKVVPDNGAVRQVLQKIYAHLYFDSWNKIGAANSYWHHPHPTSLSARMEFRLSDQNDEGIYRFSPTFPKSVVFVHGQEGQEYSVVSDFGYSTFKFIEVSKKY